MIKQSSRLIVCADGVYMGRQSVDQVGMTNLRVGFRHPGPKGKNTVANAVFADGHAESVSTEKFPCSFCALDELRQEPRHDNAGAAGADQPGRVYGLSRSGRRVSNLQRGESRGELIAA